MPEINLNLNENFVPNNRFNFTFTFQFTFFAYKIVLLNNWPPTNFHLINLPTA